MLNSWLPDNVLQSIAAENNLPETAFLVPADGLRWFTPTLEIDLCGHATLACGHVVFDLPDCEGDRILFRSQSGDLYVQRKANRLYLDFPSRKPAPCAPPPGLDAILGLSPAQVARSRDLMAVFDDEQAVRSLEPDLDAVAGLDAFAMIVTAPGKDVDFVSRFFAPGAGIGEDPVTGSAHCTLIPYWAQRLGKNKLQARQLSKRGGELFCEDRGDRVLIGGHCATYLSGTITI